MTHAYSEFYLNNAKNCLSSFFDYMINDCKTDPGLAASFFVTTGFAGQFERGNPAYLAGMSGVELAKAVISKAYGEKTVPEASVSENRSPEYWAGWALAYYQWYYARRFRDIFERIPMKDIVGMYYVYHEMDISHFADDMEARYIASGVSKLKQIRENRGLSQNDLSEQSGVNLRNIQMYEQGENNIDRAQGQILYKLSRVLGCDIEDLLENPMM